MEIKISKGIWRTSLDCCEVTTSKVGILEGSKEICNISRFAKTAEEIAANAKLIADAGNTANKCGLLPSELLEQRNDLLEALQVLIGDVDRHPKPLTREEKIEIAKQAIKKATDEVRTTQ
jgi:hypothetical protein